MKTTTKEQADKIRTYVCSLPSGSEVRVDQLISELSLSVDGRWVGRFLRSSEVGRPVRWVRNDDNGKKVYVVQ